MSSLSKAKRGGLALATGGASELYYAGKRYVNSKKDAANEAAEAQQRLYTQALGQNAFGDAKYTAAQQSIMNDLISGNDPTVSQGEVNEKMDAITPTVNQQFSNNVWSTSRAKALNNAAQNAQNALVASKKESRMTALDALRQEAANRANILTGQAAMVTPKATTADSVMDLLKTTNGIANTAASLKALA